MTRLYNRSQEAQGNPFLPGPFDTDAAEQDVATSLDTTKRELQKAEIPGRP
jgi:hypothetical protein